MAKQNQLIQQAFELIKEQFPDSKTNLKAIGLDVEVLQQRGIEFGYNGKQLSEKILMPDLLKAGLYLKKDDHTFTRFGNFGIILPLRNKQDNIVNLYAFRKGKGQTYDCFLNDKGLFPYHPPSDAQQLIITDTILDACRLIQSENKHTVVALDGLRITETFIYTIASLEKLREIILVKGEDRKAVSYLNNYLTKQFPHISTSVQTLPSL